LEYRAPLRPGRGVRLAYEKVRALVPPLTQDRPLSPDIQKIAEALRLDDFGI
ncbi:MAG: hypothetical protein H0T92_03440, partial [Pyrinomonadaceae bacterium]|nr:hypothetical protein [Pyrinomonadaceae bacterium]